MRRVAARSRGQNMSATPFLIFPWQRAFLPDLKVMLEEYSNGRPGSVLLIVPHNRPWRYLLQLYAQEGGPRLLPKVLTVSEMVTGDKTKET